MEAELFRLLGGLLGTLEAVATDAQQPLEGRQRERLQQALDLGHELKDHVEAFSFLANGDACERLTIAPYSVRRMLEHAVRSAAWQASEHGVSLTLPALDQWSERSVRVDVRALDRVIRGACEYLISVVSRGGRVEVTVSAAQGGLQVDLRGESLVEGLAPKPPSELLHAAWRRLIELHGGRFTLLGPRLHAELWLPMDAG
jgi:signal transduction histidine kinase